MGLQNVEESGKFVLRTVTQKGEEVVSANEVNTYPEDGPISLPPQRRKRPRDKQESQPKKRRRIDDAAVAEERLRRAALIKL